MGFVHCCLNTTLCSMRQAGPEALAPVGPLGFNLPFPRPLPESCHPPLPPQQAGGRHMVLQPDAQLHAWCRDRMHRVSMGSPPGSEGSKYTNLTWCRAPKEAPVLSNCLPAPLLGAESGPKIRPLDGLASIRYIGLVIVSEFWSFSLTFPSWTAAITHTIKTLPTLP